MLADLDGDKLAAVSNEVVAAGLGLLLRDQPRRASTARVVGATVQVLEVEEVKDAKVKLGDCLEVLPTLETESVQLFVTSPPLIRFREL